ncbi:hypothetical protein AN911_10255 [Mycobacteroides immunogenum]|nr:hypothetical protein AN911_10255 [Mycobacteroides immunogenum]KPG38853.1 hypothetical protein AN914_11420 [Mycobacteroides immunogenum]KPG49197.1 hypothetical protein AN916_21435 [Mycobacteroides immunogenum]
MQTDRPIEVLEDGTATLLRPGCGSIRALRSSIVTASALTQKARRRSTGRAASRRSVAHLAHRGGAVDGAVARHRAALPAAIIAPEPQDRPDAAVVAAETHSGAGSRPVLAEGTNILAISRELGLSRGTTRRFARARRLMNCRSTIASGTESVFSRHTNPSCIGGGMWRVPNTMWPFEEITAHSYQGSEMLVRDYLQPFLALTHLPVAPPSHRSSAKSSAGS